MSVRRNRNGALFLALLILLMAAGALIGCERAEPVIAGTPTPGPTATPAPEGFTLSVTGAPIETDLLGAELIAEDHFTRYLSLGEIRVYEYGTDTFLDGIVVNAYPLPLDCEMELLYHDKNGGLIGRGTLHLANGTSRIPSGSSRIYAEILTDVDVRLENFSLSFLKLPTPVEE